MNIKPSLAWRRALPFALPVLLLAGACQNGGTDRRETESQQAQRQGGETEDRTVQPAVKRFDSFAAFLTDEGDRPPGSHQVVFIGIDGADWRYLDELIERGRLPNLRRIKEEGAFGTLRSVPCYVSPPAWASMHSGFSPAKTGVYTFGKWDRESRTFRGVKADDVAVPSVWDVASQAGKKTAVVNVPLTYPVHPVNGIMVSGLLTRVIVEDEIAVRRSFAYGDLELSDVAPDIKTYSTPNKTVCTDTLNTMVWWRVDTTDDEETNYDRVVVKIFPKHGDAEQAAGERRYVFNLGDYSPWLRIEAFRDGEATDAWMKLLLFQREDGRFEARFSQTFFDVRETAGRFTHPETLADKLYSRFGYYLPSKFVKQEIVPHLAAESARYASYFYDYDDWDLFYFVFTQTDNIHHLEGLTDRAEKVYGIIDQFLGELIARLPEECTLIIGSDHGFGAFEYGVDLNRLFELNGLLQREAGGDEIDFDNTLVFHNMWHLYFNHALITKENLEAHGVRVGSSEKPLEAFVGYLQKIGRDLAASDGSLRFPLEFTPVGDDVVGDDPDMIVKGSYDGYLVEFWNLKRSRGGVVWQLIPSEKHNHLRDGVFLMWGKHVRRGYDAGTRAIEDIAPTVLYLLDLPSAEGMDGRAMYDVFEPALVAAKKSLTVADYGEIKREFVAAEKDTETLEKKLKSLGYVH